MSIFSTAQAIVSPKEKSAERVTIQIDGLRELGHLDRIIKALTTLKTVYADIAKEKMFSYFIRVGCAGKKRPKNFFGSDDNVTASCQLRKRSSKNGLNEEEIKFLKEHKIPMTVEVEVVEAFIINPAYAKDQELLKLVDDALKAKKIGLPDDFIQLQKGVKKTVVADAAMDEVFTKPAKIARQILNVIGDIAIVPAVNEEETILNSHDVVRNLIVNSAAK